MPDDASIAALTCPLCAADATQTRPFATVRERDYRRCDACHLTWMTRPHLPDPTAERARYDEHHNDPADPGYCAFLARLADPATAAVPLCAAGTDVLDFGSGPAPVLASMLTRRGYNVAIYDPFYAPDAAPLGRTYDLITCCETAEHFHSPGREFARLATLLRPGAVLAIMTCTLTDDARFPAWWYVRDPTHVCFYHADTYAWLGRRYGWQVERPHANVTLFRRLVAPSDTANDA